LYDGDAGQFIDGWFDLLGDPAIPEKHRLSGYHVLGTAYLLAGLERMLGDPERSFPEIDPRVYFHFLADAGLLSGLVRAAIADGLITLDEIDPAPED
jgi:hypothetical protein